MNNEINLHKASKQVFAVFDLTDSIVLTRVTKTSVDLLFTTFTMIAWRTLALEILQTY